eukprot:symbB.v1.2.015816.t1/scaffold1192.1/size132829/7
MAAMADRDLSAFMGRMDKLCQRLNDWKSQTPHTQPAHPSGRSQSGQLSHLSQRSQALSGSLARSLMTLRSATETSRRWNTSRPTDTVEGGTAGTAGTMEVTRESPLKPSTRSRPSRSPSKSLVSILPHSATDWLNEAKLRREEVKAEVEAFKPTRRTEGPCDGRASHGNGTREPFDVKTDWQRSRNKLMDGSPSRRRRVESKSPKRTPRSALSPSSRTSRGMDPLSSDPFHMDRPSEVKFSAMDPDRKGSKDSQATINSSFESRISALQQKASGLPRQIESRSWSRREAPKGGGSPARQDLQDAIGFSSFGSPSGPWGNHVRNSPGTGRSQRSDETLASRVSHLEDSFARIEFMLQQVLGMAGSQMQRVSSRSPHARVGDRNGQCHSHSRGSGLDPEADHHDAEAWVLQFHRFHRIAWRKCQATDTKKGLFKWPMDIAEAAELARLRQAKVRR